MHKQPEDTIFLDKRQGRYDIDLKGSYRPSHVVNPDVQADNRALPFKDNVFDMLIFDPPHIVGSTGKVFEAKYTTLNPFSWQNDLYKAFKEASRVLKPSGCLILKWAETSKSLKRVFQICKGIFIPLFGTNVNHNKVCGVYWIVLKPISRLERKQK